MQRLYAFMLVFFIGLQASSNDIHIGQKSIIKKFLGTKQGKITASVVLGLLGATSIGMAYYVWNKTRDLSIGSASEDDDMEAMKKARERITPVLKTKEELLGEELTANLAKYIKSQNILRDDWKVEVKVSNGSMTIYFYGDENSYGHNLEEFKHRRYGHYIAAWADNNKRADIKAGQFRFYNKGSKHEVFGFTLRCFGSEYSEKKVHSIKKDIIIEPEVVWQPSMQFTIPQAAKNCEVLFKDTHGKRNLRICFFDIGKEIITLDKFQKEYAQPIKDFVGSDYTWVTRGYKGTVTLEYYQANLWERYEKATNEAPLFKEILE